MENFREIMHDVGESFWAALGEEKKFDYSHVKKEHSQTEDENYCGIEIEGPSEFIKITKQALDLLFEYSPTFREQWSNETLDMIVHTEYATGMHADRVHPAFQVDEPTFQASLAWYASAIAHDNYHSVLFHQAKKEHLTDEAISRRWTGAEAEKKCLEVQINVLKEVRGRLSNLSVDNETEKEKNQTTIKDVDESIVYLRKVMENPDYYKTPEKERNW